MDIPKDTITNKKRGLSASDIASISSVIISAVALIFSTYQYLSGVEKESKVNRPIITVIKTYFSVDSVPSLIFHPTPTIQNFGLRPAYNCRFLIFEIKKDYANDSFILINKSTITAINPLIPNVPIDLGIAPISVKEDSSLYYYKINFEYSDLISNNIYKESLYFKWLYRKNENYVRSFQVTGLEIDEANKIDNFINAQN